MRNQPNPRHISELLDRSTVMASLTLDFFVLTALLAMLAYLLLSTAGINRKRRVRLIKRKITERILSWK